MDEQETIAPSEETTVGTPDTQAPVETPEVEATPEVVGTPVEAAPVEETPVVPDSTDVAPEDVPVIHEDDGSVGRELDHVVQQ